MKKEPKQLELFSEVETYSMELEPWEKPAPEERLVANIILSLLGIGFLLLLFHVFIGG